MAYYILLTRENASSHWSIQFGDKDRECVTEEVKEYRREHKASDIKIIKTKTMRQSEINAKVAELNNKVPLKLGILCRACGDTQTYCTCSR